MSSGGADVGILDVVDVANAAAAAGGAGAGGDSLDDDTCSYVHHTSRWDIYESLECCDSYCTCFGSCCAADVADGSTTTPALPSIVGLHVDGIGDLPLPLSECHAMALKSDQNTQLIANDSWHGVHSVDSEIIQIKNPTWEDSLQKLVRSVSHKFGVNPDRLSADLKGLLLLEKGSYVDRCSTDLDEEENVLGLLFVQLPSVFTGGKVSIFNNGETEYGDDEECSVKEMMSTSIFHLGNSGKASFSCHFLAHYKECDIEISRIKSGSRLMLVYALCHQEQPRPTLRMLNDSMSMLKNELETLCPADRVFLVPMSKLYPATALVQDGINSLSSGHRSRVEAIRAAAGDKWKLLVLNAEMKCTLSEYDFSRVVSNVQIFDESGRDITAREEWLQGIVDFRSTLEYETGMLLGYEEELGECWGDCERSGNTQRWTATFILAYDSSVSDVEIECLRGCDGVNPLAEKALKSRDFSLLKRVLNVVDSKTKCKLRLQPCKKILRLLTRSRSKDARTRKSRIRQVNRTLSGLLQSQEPDQDFYDAVISAIERFGYGNLTESLSKLFRRRSIHDISVFLRRADFILTLNKQYGGEATTYLEQSIQDLTLHGNRTIQNSEKINSTIFTMISQHGQEAMSPVIKAVLSFMHVRANKYSVLPLLHRTLLLWKLHEHSYEFLQTCLVEFAGDFVQPLNYYESCQEFVEGDQQKTFVKAICYLMKYGKGENLIRFGKWMASSEDAMTSLLEAFATHSKDLEFDPKLLRRDVLNKCLIQNSTKSPYRHISAPLPDWAEYYKKVDTTMSALHIHKILHDFPELSYETDGDGRLALHHACASSAASYDTIMEVFRANPKAVSVRDPVTRLYPFILAGQSNHTDASFSLLLANPSMVTGDAQTDAAASKKRKRDMGL